MSSLTTQLTRPDWAWRCVPIALAGGVIPETVLSHMHGCASKTHNKGLNKGIFGFLSLTDLTNFAQVCQETYELVLMTDRTQKQIKICISLLEEEDDLESCREVWGQEDYDEYQRLQTKMSCVPRFLMIIARREHEENIAAEQTKEA